MQITSQFLQVTALYHKWVKDTENIYVTYLENEGGRPFLNFQALAQTFAGAKAWFMHFKNARIRRRGKRRRLDGEWGHKNDDNFSNLS